jgi:hypothetical protein
MKIKIIENNKTINFMDLFLLADEHESMIYK